MYILLISLIALIILVIFVLNLPVFGSVPTGTRLERIKALPLYKDGALQNQSPTPAIPANVSYWKMIKAVLKGNPNGAPNKILPHQTPNFSTSDALKITWFGHSSYLLQVDGLNILVDPVFSLRPSPFQFIGTESFKGTNFIKVEDLPPLDIVLITHDHYDHLDYHAILKLKHKTKQFVTSLGVGSHLAYWGVAIEKINELSWHQQFSFSSQLIFTALPARHFSGRKFKRNQTLWSSFVLQTKSYRLYLGGDSGYDHHFKTIGATYGPFDLAILECGQYNEMWPLIHLFPEQAIIASQELKAKYVMPVHWGRYKLALHDWDEPIRRFQKAANKMKVPIITPMLGESFVFNENKPNANWWQTL